MDLSVSTDMYLHDGKYPQKPANCVQMDLQKFEKSVPIAFGLKVPVLQETNCGEIRRQPVAHYFKSSKFKTLSCHAF